MDRFSLGWPARLYVTIFGILWIFIFGYAFAAEVASRSPAAIAPALIAGAGVFLTYRWVALSVTIDKRGMTIRNILRTHQLSRSDVEDFVGAQRGLDRWWPGIYVQLRSGSALPMCVFSVRWGSSLVTRRTREECISTLRRWLSTDPIG